MAKRTTKAKPKLSKAQTQALDRDSNGEAGGSLSKEEQARREREEINVGRAFRGY